MSACETHGWPRNAGDNLLPCPVPGCERGSAEGVEYLSVILASGTRTYRYVREDRLEAGRRVWGWREERVE